MRPRTTLGGRTRLDSRGRLSLRGLLPRTGSVSPNPFSFSSCSWKYPPAPRFCPTHWKRQRSTPRHCPVDCSAATGEGRSGRHQHSASVHLDPPRLTSTRPPRTGPEPLLGLPLSGYLNAVPPDSA